jgi:hypothetical protein
VRVNGDLPYESLDDTRSFGAGQFAFQQHDPGSKVEIRRIEVKDCPTRPSNCRIEGWAAQSGLPLDVRWDRGWSGTGGTTLRKDPKTSFDPLFFRL